MRHEDREHVEQATGVFDPELVSFVKRAQKSSPHLEDLLESPQNACMLLKGLQALLWQDGYGGTEETSRLACNLVRDVLYALHPAFLAMATSVAVASEGEELVRLRLLVPMMENLFDKCLEYTDFFEHEFEYLRVVQVPGILLEYTLFSRPEVDPDVSSFGDIGDPCDKINFVQQMFYGFLDMIENYADIHQQVAALYSKISWSPPNEETA